MKDNQLNVQIRSMSDNEWLWLDKRVLLLYGKSVGATGMFVYSVLAIFSNNNTQQCFPSHKLISKITGLNKKTIIRKIKLLDQLGLIKKIKINQRRCSYVLLKVKGGNSTPFNLKVTEKTPFASHDMTLDTPKGDKMYTQKVASCHPNYNKRTKIINYIDKEKYLKLKNISFKGFKPKTREELLAVDIAKALNDEKGLAYYLSLSRKYPEFILRDVLGQVKETPVDKIKKSKGALFNYLIKKI